ncbi:hypothetical protein CoNPh17_CDS0103 [Staphylococcus phage S-CoN_Ph17]|nr:hypothetical protein CoNPh17_CDS0103 [Staphylococcus phage S-CoN_Ph17]
MGNFFKLKSLSSYFVLTKDVVEMMWEVVFSWSIFRGSASCFKTKIIY